MLDATTSISIPPGYAKFYGKGENTSMIKSPVITGQGFTYDGNLVIECDSHVEKNQWWENFHVLNGPYFTKMGDSKVIIDVCTGIKNGGNEGGDPGREFLSSRSSWMIIAIMLICLKTNGLYMGITI